MSVSLVRMTYFQADKLPCAGPQRQSSPYRVTTYRGPELGLLGTLPGVLYKIHELNTAEAANSDLFEVATRSLFERLSNYYNQA